MSIVSGKLIELASSTIGQRAKKVLGHRAKLGQRAKSICRDQPKAGTGHKMLLVPFVFSKSRYQDPAFRCDKIVVIVTLLEAIEGIPVKDYNFWGNENFHNLYQRLLQEQNLKSGYLEKRIYERPLHLGVNLLSRIKANIFQNYL